MEFYHKKYYIAPIRKHSIPKSRTYQICSALEVMMAVRILSRLQTTCFSSAWHVMPSHGGNLSTRGHPTGKYILADRGGGSAGDGLAEVQRRRRRPRILYEFEFKIADGLDGRV